MAGHDDAPHRIAETKASLETLASEPAPQESRHEAISCAEGVEHRDLEARHQHRCFTRGMCDRTAWAELHHEQCIRELAQRAERFLARDASCCCHFLLGTDRE